MVLTRVLFGLFLLAAFPSWADERFALVVGANSGWPQDPPLRHAESDADRVAQVLVELGQFRSDRVEVLHDPGTTQVRAALRRLSERARLQSRSLIFVYYSGHADENLLHLRGDALTFTELHQTLRGSAAAVKVGVFDACRSGAIATKGGHPTQRFEVELVDELSVRGMALLTSSGADELSQEQRALQGSVFTHNFISGLRGAADLNQNGQVSLSEAYDYAFRTTQAATAATPVPQRPAFQYDLEGQGELVLSWPSVASAALVLPRGTNSRYVVVDDSEAWVVAEAVPNPDQDVLLALPPGKYRLKQLHEQTLKVAKINLAKGDRIKGGSLAFDAVPLSAGFVKGEPALGHSIRPRKPFWFFAAGAVLSGTAWAVAGSRSLAIRNRYQAQPRPLTREESADLSRWSVGSDVAMGLTAAFALTAAFTW